MMASTPCWHHCAAVEEAAMAAAEYGRNIWESRDKEGGNGHEDLLVFGYSCKLFRDNEKALYLDKGHHLIPWMGDNSVMVDRWVGRGAPRLYWLISCSPCLSLGKLWVGVLLEEMLCLWGEG